MPSVREILVVGATILTILLAIFFWFATWIIIGSSTNWLVGLFTAIVGFVFYGVLAALIVRGLWTRFFPGADITW